MYKPKKISNEVEKLIDFKRKCNTPEPENLDSYETIAENQRAIEIEIKNLKQRLRDMDIMKIYGQKLTLPKKKQQIENNYISPR